MIWVLGFIPGLIFAKVLNAFGLLRIPRAIELAGLDVNTEIQREEEANEMKESVREEARTLGVAA